SEDAGELAARGLELAGHADELAETRLPAVERRERLVAPSCLRLRVLELSQLQQGARQDDVGRPGVRVLLDRLAGRPDALARFAQLHHRLGEELLPLTAGPRQPDGRAERLGRALEIALRPQGQADVLVGHAARRVALEGAAVAANGAVEVAL